MRLVMNDVIYKKNWVWDVRVRKRLFGGIASIE